MYKYYSMEEIEFYKIHNISIEAIGIDNDLRLEIIGKWYLKFLISDEEELILTLPKYDFEFIAVTYSYLQNISLCYSLLFKVELSNFQDTSLFDIFSYKTTNANHFHDYILNYDCIKNNRIVWANGTMTDSNNFLPVFKTAQLNSKKTLDKVYNSFQLFKIIRKHELIKYPILIDFEEDISLFFNCIGQNLAKELISEMIVSSNNKMDDDDAADLELELKEKDIARRINIKFPYSKRQHKYLVDIGNKRFDIVFNNRFFYHDISKNDIFLLPRELGNNQNQLLNNVDFNIVSTNHSSSLFKLLQDFKTNWRNLDLNKFIAPFPKYWFLFINKGLPKEKWLNQFLEDYPSLANKPIIRQIEKIISELHDLNWIEKLINTNNVKILFPELKGLRKKRLSNAFNSFKNYVTTINPDIIFIDENTSYDYNAYSNLLLLDAFNIIELVNVQQNSKQNNLTVLVPDFIYFNYQPWIKYHLFDFQSSTLFNQARNALDDNFEFNKSNNDLIRTNLIREIKTEIKAYNKKYEIEIEDPIIEEIQLEQNEDIELLNAEEIAILPLQVDITNSFILNITTTQGDEFNILSNDMILLQRDSIIKSPAKALKEGDFFLLNKDLNSLISSDKFFNKLVEVPSRVRTYQNELFAYPNIFKILKSKGVSYIGQTYFEKKYLVPINHLNDPTFRVPRRKSDWLIICKLLSIDHSDMNIGFIAYYGRTKRNRLVEIYKSVINLFLENEYFGMTGNETILNQIQKIVDESHDVFAQDKYYDSHEIASSIASSIIHELKFREVKKLKLLINE